VRVTVCGHAFELDESYLGASERAVREQLREYDAGERLAFDLDVRYADGFRGEVMAAMAAIPPGETRAYGEIADDLDTAAIAVGNACAWNPVPLVVPCHRVVGADGPGGFSSEGGLDAKRALLAHERETV
jgi:methylated-DNA-[protein]-cysteine S-methyltransferase